MELKEFEKMIADKKQEVQGIYDKAVELFESGVYDLKQYREIGAISGRWWSRDGILAEIEVKSENLEDHSVDTFIEHLIKFQSEYDNLSAIEKSSIEDNLEACDDYIQSSGYKYTYWEIREEKLESYVKSKCRELVSSRLKPNGESEIMPDCKMVELFKNGAIDWKTLQQITYKNCDI